MALNLIICDDQKTVRDSIWADLGNIIEHNCIDAKISFATEDPKEVLEYYGRETGDVNAYFMDIDLRSDMDGVQIAKMLRLKDPLCFIIFITGHQDYVNQIIGLHIEAFEYLIKPIFYSKLEECVISLDKCYKKMKIDLENTREKPKLYVSLGPSMHNVDVQEILFIEASGHKVLIHTKRQILETFRFLKDIEEELNSKTKLFFRCHRSFVVNLNHVQDVDYEELKITLSNGDGCYLSRNNKGRMRSLLRGRG